MQVILIRHAEAVDESLALRDPHRHLTLHGRRQAHGLGDRLRWHDCKPTHVWSSPLVRAVQTAELVLGRYEPEVNEDISVDVHVELAPGAERGERVIAMKIANLPPESSIFLVGHEPSISAIAGLLVGDPQFLTLAKCEAVRIIAGKLRWRFLCDGDAPIKPD